jgi:hypothetical protein
MDASDRRSRQAFGGVPQAGGSSQGVSVLKIKPYKTNKDSIKLRPLMKDCTIPKFPQSVLMVGASSSGKTTLPQNLILKKEFYKNYHDFVFLFSVPMGIIIFFTCAINYPSRSSSGRVLI